MEKLMLLQFEIWQFVFTMVYCLLNVEKGTIIEF